jgi:hypothetical protein
MNACADLLLGVRRGLPFGDYLKVRALSNSGLKLLAKSPRHYAASWDPERPDAEPSDALRRGSLLHTLALEPHTFAQRYRVKPAGMNFATKDGKAWRDATPKSVEVVSEAEHAAAVRQAANLRQLPEVAALLGAGESEVSFFWIDPRSGAYCKGRADWVFRAPGGVVLLDLKTTEDATPDAFARSVVRYGYHRQAALYSEGWTLATGEPVLGFVFGAVESAWPHDAVPYMLDDEAMSKARAQIESLMDLHAECERADQWPGICHEITTLSLPAWA